MSCLLGIDLGTSGVKVIVLTLQGGVAGVGSAEYPIQTPQPGYAEQDPERWWQATILASRQALRSAGHPEILGIGFSGQMHGGVLLGNDLQPLHAAVIWPDQRSSGLLVEIEDTVGKKMLAETCGTAPAAGFLISTLFWMKKFAPALLERTACILFPKDYVRLKLSNEAGTDDSDAAASGLFNVRERRWADEVIARLGLPGEIFPQNNPSNHIIGGLQSKPAAELGLKPGIPIVAGSADQPAQAVGNGLIDPPVGSVTIGTGGQVFLPLSEPVLDQELRLHTFCHAPGSRWYLLGAMLAAGMALRWLREFLGEEKVSYRDLDILAAEVPPGSEGLIFLPYLVGERSPLMDPCARGAFIGLTLRHRTGHLVRAVLEGIAFALRQITDTMVSCGAPVGKLVASGNGLASPIWRQILTEILNRPLSQGVDAHSAERAGMGAALMAGIGAGCFKDFAEVKSLAPEFSLVTEPDRGTAEKYQQIYPEYLALYPRLRDSFAKLGGPKFS